jgi:quercetin dioxygenase-like cupin family protein
MKNQKPKGGAEMNNTICLIMRVMLIVLVLGFFTNMAVAADPVQASADVKVLLDNDQVRVFETTRSPGTKVPMHTHPTFISYYFNPTKIKVTLPNGKIIEKDIPAGNVNWKPNGATHAVEIMGTNSLHALVIELKNQ